MTECSAPLGRYNTIMIMKMRGKLKENLSNASIPKRLRLGSRYQRLSIVWNDHGYGLLPNIKFLELQTAVLDFSEHNESVDEASRHRLTTTVTTVRL